MCHGPRVLVLLFALVVFGSLFVCLFVCLFVWGCEAFLETLSKRTLLTVHNIHQNTT